MQPRFIPYSQAMKAVSEAESCEEAAAAIWKHQTIVGPESAANVNSASVVRVLLSAVASTDCASARATDPSEPEENSISRRHLSVFSAIAFRSAELLVAVVNRAVHPQTNMFTKFASKEALEFELLCKKLPEDGSAASESRQTECSLETAWLEEDKRSGQFYPGRPELRPAVECADARGRLTADKHSCSKNYVSKKISQQELS